MTQALSVAFQMDPIELVDIDADSSFRLAEAAQARGHNVHVYTPDRLCWQNGQVTARGWAGRPAPRTWQPCHQGPRG